MTTHDRDKIIATAKEAGFSVSPVTGSIYLIDGYKEAICTLGVSKLYAIAFEAGRQSVDTPVALAEAYRCGEEAGRQAEREEINQDAERYRWLRTHALQRAWVSLGTDCDGENFVDLRCEFKVPEPPNLPYEDDEGLEWSDKDFDSAIDTAIRARGDMK